MKRFLQYLATGFTALIGTGAFAQTDSLSTNVLEQMSLKELLNLKIVSASKTSESLFESPLSASVLTREDMLRNGCTSIMEALRLVPGMIVREQSNGNYDIHLRGLDNVPPNASFDITSNTTTLVMIDGRPVYSYLRGGTFWETLPVDMNDVEKIEVVRGPAAALYGPNAVQGVINIITRQATKKGLYASAGSQTGSLQTIINHAALGYRFNRFNIIGSVNYQYRQRSQSSYFEYNRNRLIDDPDYMLNFLNDTVRNISEQFPQQRLAMEKLAGNVFAGYEVSDKLKFNLSSGIQHSFAQRVSTENGLTPLSTVGSDSRYVDLRAVVNGFTAQFSYNGGTQLAENAPGNKYDFHIYDANIEYNFTKGDLTIRPGLSYRSAVYDDTKYSDMTIKNGIFSARGEIDTRSASLRTEYKLFNDRLRLVAGIAANQFNYPDTTYLSYELAGTYKIGNKHLLRAVVSKSPRSSNIFDTYVNQGLFFYPTGANQYTSYWLLGNKNIQLLTAAMFEAGYRGHIAKRLNIDIEAFHVHSHHYSSIVQHPDFTVYSGADTITVRPLVATTLPIHINQNGITVSFNYSARLWQFKPFITVQKTTMENYIASSSLPGAQGNLPSIYDGKGNKDEVESTPNVYGGATLGYKPYGSVGINLSAYYYTAQTYSHLSNLVYNDGVRGIDHIPGKCIINANVSYEPAKGILLYCTVKNLLNQKSREFFRTDEAPVLFLGGIHYQL